MALECKVGGVTYRCVDDYSIRQQGGAVSTTTLNVKLDSNPVPLAWQVVQLYLDGALFFSGLVRTVSTPEYSTAHETQVFAMEVSSLELLLQKRLVTKNFYYYTFASWTAVVQWIFDNYVAAEGITLGYISTTAETFDSKWSVSRKPCSDVLNDVAAAVGNATWWISADRKFYFKVATDFTEVVPPTRLSALKMREDAADLRTVQTVVGASSGVNATAENAALIATIAARTGGSGRIESVETDSGIHSDSKAATAAAAKLAGYAETVKDLTLTCHDLAASSLYLAWPLTKTINGVVISGTFVVVERTITHRVGSQLDIQVKLKNANYFARYGYSLKTATTIARASEGAILDQYSDDALTPAEKKEALADWEAALDEKAGYDASGARYGLTALTEDYDDAFQALADYLNGGEEWTSGDPAWLAGAELTSVTEVDGAEWRVKWLSYYNARTALTAGIRSAETVLLSTSTTSVMRSAGGLLDPPSITMTAEDQNGNPFLGVFSVAVSQDGTAYEDDYESSAPEAAHTYSIPLQCTIDEVTGFTTSVRVRLFATGGAKIGERYCTVMLSTAVVPTYLGAKDADPEAGFVDGDYYFDSRPQGSGGGQIRYYTGTAWEVMPTDHPSYEAAVSAALRDMMAWATAEGGTIAAAQAVFNAISANKGFYDGLFSNDLTVYNRLTAYSGIGSERRAVRQEDGAVKWMDSPDGGGERTVAKISRIRGKLNSVLMAGEFLGVVPDATWSEAASLAVTSYSSPSIIQKQDGTVIAFYIDGSRSDNLYSRTWTGTAWGAETLVLAQSIIQPTAYEDSFGTVHVVFAKLLSGSTFLPYVMTFSGGAWGAPVCLSTEYGVVAPPILYEDSIGRLRCMFSALKTDFSYSGVIDFTLIAGSWSNPTPISGFGAFGAPKSIRLEDGRVLVTYTPNGTSLWFRTYRAIDDEWDDAIQVSTYTAEAFPGIAAQLPDGSISFVYRKGGTVAPYPVYETIYKDGVFTVKSTPITAYAAQGYFGYFILATGIRILIYKEGTTNYFSWRFLTEYQPVTGYPISGYVAGRGWWQKHADGTLEQWGIIAVGAVNLAYMDYYYRYVAVTFPISFISIDCCVATGNSSAPYTVNTSYPFGLTGVTLEATSIRNSYVCPYASWVAIGRWKA